MRILRRLKDRIILRHLQQPALIALGAFVALLALLLAGYCSAGDAEDKAWADAWALKNLSPTSLPAAAKTAGPAPVVATPPAPVITSQPAPTQSADGPTPADAAQAGPPAPAINWVSPEEAAKSPLPNWYHVSADDPRTCPDCMKADSLLDDPRCVAWSRLFDCVRVPKITGERNTVYTTDIFVTADLKSRYKRYVPGCPDTAEGYLRRFAEAFAVVRALGSIRTLRGPT